MSPQRFQRVREIYHAALACPVDQRAAFLIQMCSGDDALKHEVQSLLAAEAEAGSFMATRPDAAADTKPIRPSGMPLTGRTLGFYEVLSLPGRGGMGEVRNRA